MASNQKRIINVRTKFLSPFRHIFKPKTENLDKKPLTMNLLTSYLRYKKNPLSGSLNDHLKLFLKSMSRKDQTSSLLITMKNFMNQKRVSKHYKINKNNFNKNSTNKNKNKKNKRNYFYSTNETEKMDKYNKRYRYLMDNLSINGNNSNASFKNISNNMLDDIFKPKPFISFDATNIKVVNKTPEKYQNFFKSISNQSRALKYFKNQDFQNFDRKTNIYKNNRINSRISFENLILNKLSEKKEADDINTDSEYNLIQPKYLDFNKNNYIIIHKRDVDKKEFYNSFKTLRKKLKKQNEVSDKIIKDIKRQQSLTKYNIQVGIVKLNEYKIKLRQLKKSHNYVH